MSEYLAPGVYVEELPCRSHPIEGVSTSTAGFLGVSPRASKPVLLTSYPEFERSVGPDSAGFLSLAVRGFFENGGRRCYVALIAATDPIEAGLDALARENLSILCFPDEHRFQGAPASLAAHCEQRKDRVCILQSPQPDLPDTCHTVPTHSSYAAYYHPWLVVQSPDGQRSVTIPSGGHVAGAWARLDIEHGVQHTPGRVRLLGVEGLSQEIDSAESELLVARGVNVLRRLPEHGIVVWSARTTSLDPEWKYVNVRRLLIFVERSIDRGLQWAVFEPNGPALWANVGRTIEDFLRNLWTSGALVGQKPEGAFFVRLDRTTMTQSDIDAGRLIAIVGVAPVRPAEFVLLRVTCQTAATPGTPP
jgi:phage tail sheath protein FI